MSSTYQLSQGNIVVRRFEMADAPVLAGLLNNRKIWDNLRDYIPYPYAVDDAIAFIQKTGEENPPMSFAIVHDGQFCGAIGLVAQTDVYKRTAEIGYWLGEPFWNKGIATVAVQLLTEYAFTQLNFIRVHTGVFEYNAASMKVLLKNEYVQDAIFKKAIVKNGKIFDEHRFSKWQ